MQKIKSFFRNKEYCIIVLLSLLALLLRLFYLNYRLPKLYLEDEEFFVKPALHVAGFSFFHSDFQSLNPHWFGAPGQTLIYLVAAAMRITNIAVNIWNHTKITVENNYKEYIALFQTAGRVIPALAGTFMIPAAWYVGRQWSKKSGIISACLVTISFYLVDHSHIIRPDIMQMLFILFSLGFCLRLFDNPKNIKYGILSGAFFGLGITTKYPTLFIIPGLFACFALLWKQKKLFWKPAFAWLCSSFIATFMSGPFLFLDMEKVIKNFQTENRIEHGGHDGLGFLGNLKWYACEVLDWEVGTFLYIIAICTCVILVFRFFARKEKKRETKMLIVIITTVSYLFCISSLHLHWQRWAIPIATFCLIFAAIGIDAIFSKIKNRALIIIILCIISLAPAMRLLRTLYQYSHENTLDKAYSWIMRNVPAGSSIIRESFTPELPEDAFISSRIPNLTYYTLNQYKDMKVTHVILSGKVYGTIRYEASLAKPKEHFVKAMKKYDELFANSTRIATISQNPSFMAKELLYSNDLSVLRTWRIDVLMGPEIHIHKLNPPADNTNK